MSTQIMADGTNNTGVSLGRTIVSFTPETVQEFTVQTSAFSAQYGNTGGGVINATTKSGTNTFTGTALWYNRNPSAAAAPGNAGVYQVKIKTPRGVSGGAIVPVTISMEGVTSNTPMLAIP